jgi:citrate synthase
MGDPADRARHREDWGEPDRAPSKVDFALAAAASALGLPQKAALGLFVIGRTVGWIAHAIEQYDNGVLIRPRARYLGERPKE